MAPVPPRKALQALRYGLGKPPPHEARRVARDDRIVRHVLGDDGSGRDHRAGADAASRQDDGAVTDPDVVPDRDPMAAPPSEEFVLVRLTGEVRARTVGEVRLAGALHRMIAGVDACHGGDRTELADRRVGDVAVVDNVGIVAQLDLEQLRARPDFAIHAQAAVTNAGGRIDEGNGRERFGTRTCLGHGEPAEWWGPFAAHALMTIR